MQKVGKNKDGKGEEVEFKKQVIEVYSAEDKNHSADIEFVDGTFNKCDFRGMHKTYTLDDWKFLNELSAKVLEMVEKGEK